MSGKSSWRKCSTLCMPLKLYLFPWRPMCCIWISYSHLTVQHLQSHDSQTCLTWSSFTISKQFSTPCHMLNSSQCHAKSFYPFQNLSTGDATKMKGKLMLCVNFNQQCHLSNLDASSKASLNTSSYQDSFEIRRGLQECLELVCDWQVVIIHMIQGRSQSGWQCK
jgi:hypothetical protein